MTPRIESLLDELTADLDDEIELLEVKRVQLAELSRTLIERDNEAIEVLFERMQRTEGSQASVDARLTSVRRLLATALGCEAAELKLSKLIAELPRPQAVRLDHRRRTLIELAKKLRQQHLETALLLTECARITHMMLDSMLPADQAVVTYGVEGSDLWRQGAGLLDTEL